MKTSLCTRFALVLLLICVPAVLLAGDAKDHDKSDHDNGSLIVINDHNGDTSIIFEDGVLTITEQDGDDSSIHVIDMDAMGMMASDIAVEVMSELEIVMANLDDMQIQFRMGEDNRSEFSVICRTGRHRPMMSGGRCSAQRG